MVSTVRYLMRTEVHTFAFSVAANAILSFFPFVMLVMLLVRRVFRSPAMYEVVVQLLRDYLPAGQDFVIRNLNAMVGARHQTQLVSLVILLVTSTGIFLPLEVALNRIWGFPENRSYLGNQLISLGLSFWCGVMALVSIGMSAGNVELMEIVLRGHGTGFVRLMGFLSMKIFAIGASIAIFFLIYWLLPNGKVPARAELRGSLRAVFSVGEPDVLGVPLGIAAADGRSFVGTGTCDAEISQLSSWHRSGFNTESGDRAADVTSRGNDWHR